MQQAAALLQSGFDNSGLSWLTPSLGTVDELAPMDAQPPNLREEMCGGHRRKPPSEDNDEAEEGAATAVNAGSPHAFMLSSLKPSVGKFVLGPPVDTTPPVVVFTGPADHPDPVQEARPVRRSHTKVAHHGKPEKKAARKAVKPRRHRKAKVSAAAK